jgi:tetratricopeptide (TPR) repeat protein
VLGQVRCALANDNPTEAGELLSQVISRHEASADRHVLGECLHLQARLALLELGPAAALDPFDTDALAWPPLDGGLDRYPDWLGIGEESHQSGFVAQIVNTLLATEVEKTTHSHEMVANLLRRALAAAPNHPAARAVRVTLANFDFRAGRLSEANRAYRQILDGSPHAPEALHAAYNLGLIELRQLDPHAAQARFLEVIDRGPGTRWADYAWWWIARSHLDAGDAAAAQKPLHTALAGKTKEVASAAALGLCACHLLEGDDEGARAVLRTHRVGTREAHAALAEFFEALVRFRSSPSESRGETLLAALGIVDEGRPLGATGVLLTGQAYRDLGLHERAVRLYDAGAAAFRGSLAVRMTFETAERFDRLDLRREARQRYLAVTVMDPRGLGPRAALRVADIAARDGKGSECVSRCRELIDQPGVELAEVLAVMGHGYELQGKYRLAAECFAGRVPAE